MQVQVRNFPQLHALCWNRPDDTVLDGKDALALYERNWRFIDEDALTDDERCLIDTLVADHGGGVLNV